MRDDAVLGRALPLDRGLGPILSSHPVLTHRSITDDISCMTKLSMQTQLNLTQTSAESLHAGKRGPSALFHAQLYRRLQISHSSSSIYSITSS